MKIQVDTYCDSELTDQQITAILSLTDSIWPRSVSSIVADVETFKQRIINNPELAAVTHRIVVWDSSRAIAHAQVFPREIFLHDSQDNVVMSATVQALAGVCTAADCRGRGLGMAIVRRAFDRLRTAMSASLFQTGVPRFYENLGAMVVQNRFVNKKHKSDPTANPWWDENIMIYPAENEWSGMTIDLNGPGY